MGLSDIEFTNLILVPWILVSCFANAEKHRTGTKPKFTEAFYQQRYIEHLNLGFSDEWPRSPLQPSEMAKKRVFEELRLKFPSRSFEHLDTSWFVDEEDDQIRPENDG